MARYSEFFGRTKMTTAILALVVLSIVGSIAVVSSAIYFNMRNQALSASQQLQLANLGIAATILERRISGSALTWSIDGNVNSFQTWKIPAFDGSEIIDSITRLTKQDAIVYAFDAASGSFTSKTASPIGADGGRIVDATIDARSPAYASLTDHKSFVGEIDQGGAVYLAAVHPIESVTDGSIIGAMLVGESIARVQASANSVLGTIAVVGGPVMFALSILGFFLSRAITSAIPRLAKSMATIAGGNHTMAVPYTRYRNEVGEMARAVEIFRENGLRVREMTEAEAVRMIGEQQDRRTMMAALQLAFGEVVDAAVAGDFSKQVTVQFPDPELTVLAESVNTLVETFDRGVREVGDVLRAMANTDFTPRVTGNYAGALAALKDDVNAVADRLADVLGNLRRTSVSLNKATSEILSGANDLSERTTRQAATIEETSAAIEQLTGTVLENAQQAGDANSQSIHVCRTAEEGGAVMNEAISAMEKISTSSDRISNIIGMIDDIAFQTNLLALNASVEAARAGDAGKGFAVVAVEVRRLAQSTANASAEVKALIDQSIQDVSGGRKLVSEAATKLTAMLDAVRSNSQLMDSIARNSRDQATAIEEVAAAIRQMDEMTQHNAALVEQTNAAIEQTEAQANELDRVVDVFRVEITQQSAQRPRLRLAAQGASVRSAG